MPVWKRFNGKKISPEDKNWDRGTWVAEGKVNGKRYKQAFRFARTEEEANDLEFAIMRELGGLSTKQIVQMVKKRNRRRNIIKAASHYVYVLESGGYYKIGRTCNLAARQKAITDTIIPFETNLVCAVQRNDAKEMEKMLHQRFLSNHIRGEWFQLDESDLTELRQILAS